MGDAKWFFDPQHFVDYRRQKEDGADHARHRVAGQAEQWCRPELAEDQRLAGAHRDLPEIDRQTVGCKGTLDQIVLAHGSPAASHQEIGPGGPGSGFAYRNLGVAGDAEIDRHAAALGDEGGHRRPVRADDLVRPDGLAGHDDLITRRHHGDARPAPYLQPGHVHRRGQANLAGAQPGAGLEPDHALRKIEPGLADVMSRTRAFFDCDARPVNLGVFLDDDGVGAPGHGAAGEDAHCLAGPNIAFEDAARGCLADPFEHCRHTRYVLGADRVAVHRRDRDRRLRAARDNIFGQHPAERVRQPDLLG